jgi:hypothetical protein
MTGTRSCALAKAVGDGAPCSEAACAYWQAGGDDLDGGCAIERLDLHHLNVDVAGFLLDVRCRLESSAAT